VDAQLAQLLQQQLASGNGAGSAEPQQLEQLAALLTRRESELQSDLERQELEQARRQEEADRFRERMAKRQEQATALRSYVTDLVEEVTVLRETVDTLAAALGACAECWGEDPTCRWCRGRGLPGFAPPEPAAFDQLVAPAVRAHTLQRRRSEGIAVDRATDERTQERSPI
jgi:hypothetical protein